MIIIGVDYHPEFQQIALLDDETGEFQEKRLAHPAEAEQFYRALAATGQKVREVWSECDLGLVGWLPESSGVS